MIGFLLWVGVALAQGSGRTVGEHRFEIPSVIPAPFVTTHFGFEQGGALLHIPDFRVEGYDEAFDLRLFGATERFDLGVRLWPRIGVHGNIEGQITTGLSEDSAFFEGARSALGWDVGALHTTPLSHAVQLAVQVVADRRDRLVLNPSGIVDAVVDDREETIKDVLDGDYLKYLLTTERESTYGGSLGVAWAHSKQLGVIASFTLRHGTTQASFFNGEKDVVIRRPKTVAGSGLAVDVHPGDWPVKGQLEYRYRIGVEGPGIEVERARLVRHTTTVGVFYAGEPRLQLGLLMAGRLTRSGNSKERFASGEFVMRYFFPAKTPAEPG